VAYFEAREIACGICLAARAQKVRVLTPRNREQLLSRNRVLYSSRRLFAPDGDRTAMVEALREGIQRQRALAETIPLEQLWELLAEDDGAYDARFLAELHYSGEPDPDQVIALLRALNADHVYFRQKGGVFRANPPDVVEQNRLRIARERAQRAELAAVTEWMRACWRGESPPRPPSAERYVKMLQDLVLHGAESSTYKQAKELVKGLGLSGDDIPFRLLVRLGVWDEDENLDLLRFGTPVDWPEPVLAEARAVTLENDPLPAREDLRHWSLFTIDGPETRDMDDALSLEPEDGGWVVGVHISDVASVIRPDSALDREAYARATSVYMPDLRIPMLPEFLSEDLLSLVQGADRWAVSLIVQLDAEGEILRFRVTPSLVRVAEQLTYAQATERIEAGDERLASCLRLALRLRERRLENGAIIQNKPELRVIVHEDRSVTLRLEPEETPSGVLVSELMILANATMARFLGERGVPAIFRSQKRPQAEVTSMLRFDPLFFYRQRRLLNRAAITTSPEPHFALGAEAYATFTSPIRRYQDLVNQRQLLAAVTGAQPYDEETLQQIIAATRPPMVQANILEDQRTRYWLIRHLEGQEGRRFDAVILDVHPYRFRVHVVGLMLETELPHRRSDLKPGQTVSLRLSRANARSGALRFALDQS